MTPKYCRIILFSVLCCAWNATQSKKFLNCAKGKELHFDPIFSLERAIGCAKWRDDGSRFIALVLKLTRPYRRHLPSPLLMNRRPSALSQASRRRRADSELEGLLSNSFLVSLRLESTRKHYNCNRESNWNHFSELWDVIMNTIW